MPFAYYNEFDKSAAEWLRQLIKEGAITDGVVDERSIEDVVPTELAEFDRCHFFAGIGAWDYALTAAGWRDGDGQVWTGSCPCQPFSSAGKGIGFADERHLWPAWFHLIQQCRPRVIFGEQVSSKDTMPWIDLVHADLEGALYTVGAADLCSPSVGAPHIRQRLYFVAELANTASDRRGRERPARATEKRLQSGPEQTGQLSPGLEGRSVDGESDELAKPVSVGRRGRSDGDTPGRSWEIQTPGRGSVVELGDAGDTGFQGRPAELGLRSESRSVADPNGGNSGTERQQCGGQHGQQPQDGGIGQLGDADRERPQRLGTDNGTQGRQDSQRPARLPDGAIRANGSILADTEGTELAGNFAEEGRSVGRSPTNGFWRDAEWIYCRDGKWRPVGTVESGAFEMADELAADLGYLWDQSSGRYTISPLIEKGKGRVARLRGYGNAITAEVAIAFISSYLEVSNDE